MENPSRPRVRLLLTEAEAEKAGLLDRFNAVLRRREARARRNETIEQRLHALLAEMENLAEHRDWSCNQLLTKTGLSWGTWLRLKKGQADARHWLPRLRAALERLR